MHVSWVSNPDYVDRAIRLRPDEYRRLWAAIRAEFELDANGQPKRVDHPGYGRSDAFYWSGGRFSALNTCNTWATAAPPSRGPEDRLRARSGFRRADRGYREGAHRRG